MQKIEVITGRREEKSAIRMVQHMVSDSGTKNFTLTIKRDKNHSYVKLTSAELKSNLNRYMETETGEKSLWI